MRTLKIGTRRSRLATVQAEQVQAMLRLQGAEAELVPMATSGDQGGSPSAAPGGLKGLWIDTLVEALRDGQIDLAVHSAKDLPAADLGGVVIGAVPEREDPRDVLVMRENTEGPTAGMRVGTSSLRRKAQLLASFPDVEVTDLRGNVDTRLRKVAEGEVDAAVLAVAGLVRLGFEPEHMRAFTVEEMLPAPGQGCLAIQCREDDRALLAVLMLLEHRSSRLALDAERPRAPAPRAARGPTRGGHAPPPLRPRPRLGALAAAHTDALRLAACVAAPDGSQVVRAAGEAADPERVAAMVADQLLSHGADKILEEVRGT